MISEDDARRKIIESSRPLSVRTVSLVDALDCFAGQDYFARLPLPNFDNSAMDGYAVIASDCQSGRRLRVIGEQPAGVDRKLRVSTGNTVRIFTGAPIPAGADAVVMQEDVTREENEIVVNAGVDPGEFIRTRGCDLSEGQKFLGQGERIRPATLALLAAEGIVDPVVGGEVSAGIVSTGDELVKAGEPLQSGQIYESNSILLTGLLKHCGAAVRSSEHCRDVSASLIEAIKRGIENHVLIISGGVSVGEHDLVKSALQSLGGKIDIWRVAIKPGKPFLFGRMTKQGTPSPQSSPSGRGGHRSRVAWESGSEAVPEAPGEGCLVFGLPGNPVSAFVTFLRFVRPAILRMMGASDLDATTVPAKLMVDLNNDGDRAHYIRGKIENGEFAPVGRQESHALFGLSQSTALLRLAPGEKLKRGAAVQVQIVD